MFVLFPAG